MQDGRLSKPATLSNQFAVNAWTIYAIESNGTLCSSSSQLRSHKHDCCCLLHRVQAGKMPLEKQGQSQKLPRSETALLERWITAGPEWPYARKLELFERTREICAGRDRWSGKVNSAGCHLAREKTPRVAITIRTVSACGWPTVQIC